jgi:CheY-like chemotaxis protein
MDEREKRVKPGLSAAQGEFCPLPAYTLDAPINEADNTEAPPSPEQERSSLFGAPLRIPSARPALPVRPVSATGTSTTACESLLPEVPINMLSYLIVDDVIPSCHVAQTILRALGVSAKKIYIASNLYDAHRLMRSTPIQVIISDLNLTDGSGLDLLYSIRAKAETRHIPFVLVTNTPELAHITEAKELGVSSCLVKPLSVANLQLHIEYAIRACNPPPCGSSVTPPA